MRKKTRLLIVGITITVLVNINAGTSLFAVENETIEEEGAEAKQGEQAESVEAIALRNDRALAEQLVDGEVKWLSDGETQFLGVFNPDSSGKALGSILILPAPGHSPIEAGALPLLGKELSSNGWHSLAISLPELDFSGPTPAFPSAETATPQNKTETDTEKTLTDEETSTVSSKLPDEQSWYSEQQTQNMEKLLKRLLPAETELLARNGKYVLLAQGTTAGLVLELISNKMIKPAGFISLNLQHPVYRQLLKIPKNLAAIKVPVLDIINVSSGTFADKRKAKQRDSNYRQYYIPGKGINFRGSEALLVKRVKGWLKKNYSK